MALEVYEFAVTIPAGTVQASPQTTDMKMPPRLVQELQVVVPPGPGGEVGWQIGAAGNPVIPRNSGAYVITDDEKISWTLEGQIDSGAWQLIGYNTGQYPHTIYVRFLVTLPGVTPQAVQPIAAGALTPEAGPGVPFGASAPPLSSAPGPGLPPLPPVPVPPVLMPPIEPSLSAPGGAPAQLQGGGVARAVVAFQYGGEEHLFHVDRRGALQHDHRPRGGAGAGGGGWARDNWAWASGLAPGAQLVAGTWGGLAHVLVARPGGGVLHLAQPDSGGAATSWGGEVIGGSGGQ